MCGSNLALILQASDTVILSRNGAYLRFSQSGNINSSAFEVLLNDRIVFHHWFQRPDERVAYDISVTVSISDGMFTNNATAVITVEVINVRPSVLLDGNVSGCDVLNHTVIWFVKWETVDAVAFDYFCVAFRLLQVPTVSRSVVVTDGLSASPISASAKLTDDHAQLDHLVLTLSNIQHRNDESLCVSQQTVGSLRVVSICSHCTRQALSVFCISGCNLWVLPVVKMQYNSTTGILLLQGPAPVSAFEDSTIPV